MSDSLKDTIAGGFGGMCTVIAGHPLDTIKVRLQTQGTGAEARYKGTLDCFTQTLKSEGFFGLYKGMGAPLAGVTPMFAVCFFGFGVGKNMQTPKGPNGLLTIGQTFNAGLLSGIFTTAIMTPGERIKCLLQIQADSTTKKYAGPVDCAKQIMKSGGITSLYRGTCGTLLRDVPGSGIYFGGYEFLKRAFSSDGTGRELKPLNTMAAGGLAGTIMWLCVIPADTIKSRFQTAPEGKFSGVLDVLRHTIKNDGPAALYRGITPILLRAFPANAACFLGYEVVMKLLNMVW